MVRVSRQPSDVKDNRNYWPCQIKTNEPSGEEGGAFKGDGIKSLLRADGVDASSVNEMRDRLNSIEQHPQIRSSTVV